MDISLHSVADRGVPNSERIALQVAATCRLSEYGIALGLEVGGSSPRPYVDSCFFFASTPAVEPGDWVLVYTGLGESGVFDLPAPGSGKIYTYYWGRTETMFYHPSRVPILFHVWETATLPAPPLMLPQSQGPASAPPPISDRKRLR
jgi:hypothetical protein